MVAFGSTPDFVLFGNSMLRGFWWDSGELITRTIRVLDSFSEAIRTVGVRFLHQERASAAAYGGEFRLQSDTKERLASAILVHRSVDRQEALQIVERAEARTESVVRATPLQAQSSRWDGELCERVFCHEILCAVQDLAIRIRTLRPMGSALRLVRVREALQGVDRHAAEAIRAMIRESNVGSSEWTWDHYGTLASLKISSEGKVRKETCIDLIVKPAFKDVQGTILRALAYRSSHGYTLSLEYVEILAQYCLRDAVLRRLGLLILPAGAMLSS